MKALVIGGSSWDTLIHVGELKEIPDDLMLWADNVVETVGGTGAGKALCLDALGNEVTFITDIGNDEIGSKIMNYFANKNLKFLRVETDYSTAHTNIMHSGGNRISIFTSTPTVQPKIPKNIDDLIEESDVVFLNINNFCRAYIPYLKKHDKLVVVDIHDYDPPNPYHDDFIEIADIITASGVTIKDHKTFIKQQIDNGKKAAVITKGKEGLTAIDSQYNFYELGGYNEPKYIDSNGAGDSFCSGFAMSLLENNDFLEALEFGTICGGLACTAYDLFNYEYDKEKVLEIKKRVNL